TGTPVPGFGVPLPGTGARPHTGSRRPGHRSVRPTTAAARVPTRRFPTATNPPRVLARNVTFLRYRSLSRSGSHRVADYSVTRSLTMHLRPDSVGRSATRVPFPLGVPPGAGFLWFASSFRPTAPPAAPPARAAPLPVPALPRAPPPGPVQSTQN